MSMAKTGGKRGLSILSVGDEGKSLSWEERGASGHRSHKLRTHLPDIVEVPVGHFLLSSQFLHLVEQNMHLEFGAQVLQPAVAE